MNRLIIREFKGSIDNSMKQLKILSFINKIEKINDNKIKIGEIDIVLEDDILYIFGDDAGTVKEVHTILSN
jgi:hypothetical protein